MVPIRADGEVEESMQALSKRYLSSPLRAYRDTPVVMTTVVMLAGYTLWIGYVLINVSSRLPVTRLSGYHGPLAIMNLTAWGWCYVGVGVLELLRMVVQAHRRTSMTLHLISMSVILGWAVSYDLGPAGTGQPAYTFVAIVAFSVPFIADVIERRYGQRRPPLA